METILVSLCWGVQKTGNCEVQSEQAQSWEWRTVRYFSQTRKKTTLFCFIRSHSCWKISKPFWHKDPVSPPRSVLCSLSSTTPLHLSGCLSTIFSDGMSGDRSYPSNCPPPPMTSLSFGILAQSVFVRDSSLICLGADISRWGLTVPISCEQCRYTLMIPTGNTMFQLADVFSAHTDSQAHTHFPPNKVTTVTLLTCFSQHTDNTTFYWLSVN